MRRYGSYSKYGNQKVTVNDIKFDSKREANHYLYLKGLQNAGKIWNLQLQTKLNFRLDGKHIFNYFADFSYEDDEGIHYIDVKSPITAKNPTFRLKKKIIEASYKIEIEVVE